MTQIHCDMKKTIKTIATYLGILLVCISVFCRYSVGLADFYSLRIYPCISDTLSFVSSSISFPLQEIAIIVIVIASICIPVIGWKHGWKAWRCMRLELLLLMWTYVWFYWGWCINYSRSSLTDRASASRCEYNEDLFKSFLMEYTDSLNSAWAPEAIADFSVCETEAKEFYANVPTRFGLASPRRWHHPKGMLLNPFYSAVGVSGFIAPLFAESCLNSDLLPFEYPFVYAHEYSHLLGVANEAEANWWAYQYCVTSKTQAIRYSGYKGILPYIINNARGLLTEKEYQEWIGKIRPEVIKDLKTSATHWQSLRSPSLDHAQSRIYDLFLKNNNIASGQKNYSEVVQLIINVKLER